MIAVDRYAGKFYFSADDCSHGFELWTSDGFASGTNLVVDIRKGRGSSFPSFITVFLINNIESYLIFSASDGYQNFKGSDTDGK